MNTITYVFRNGAVSEVPVSRAVWEESELMRKKEESADRRARYHNYSLDLWMENGEQSEKGQKSPSTVETYPEDNYIPSDAAAFADSVVKKLSPVHKRRFGLYLKYGNVSTAAKKEGVSQSAVYKSIYAVRKTFVDELAVYSEKHGLGYSPEQLLSAMLDDKKIRLEFI